MDAERYAVVVDELAAAEDYFQRLNDELGDAYPAFNAKMVVDAIQRLRDELRREQRDRAVGKRGET